MAIFYTKCSLDSRVIRNQYVIRRYLTIDDCLCIFAERWDCISLKFEQSIVDSAVAPYGGIQF